MPASVPLAVGTCIRTPVRIPAPCDKTSTTPQEMQKRDLYIGPLRHVTPRHRDPMRKPDGVVLDPDPVQLSFEHDGVGDVFEVGPLALDVTEEALDPGLVGRGVRAAVMLSDGQQCHE